MSTGLQASLITLIYVLCIVPNPFGQTVFAAQRQMLRHSPLEVVRAFERFSWSLDVSLIGSNWRVATSRFTLHALPMYLLIAMRRISRCLVDFCGIVQYTWAALRAQENTHETRRTSSNFSLDRWLSQRRREEFACWNKRIAQVWLHKWRLLLEVLLIRRSSSPPPSSSHSVPVLAHPSYSYHQPTNHPPHSPSVISTKRLRDCHRETRPRKKNSVSECVSWSVKMS